MPEPKRLVVVESPFKSKTQRGTKENKEYARACLRDCLKRGEAPFASHLLYTQEGVLDDNDPEERRLGIEAGLAFGRVVDAAVVYVDHGITDGMRQGIARHKREGRPIELRTLYDTEVAQDESGTSDQTGEAERAGGGGDAKPAHRAASSKH